MNTSSCFVLIESTDDGTQRSGSEVLCNQPFLINYLEPEAEAEKRFKEWLDKVVMVGLRLWQDNL